MHFSSAPSFTDCCGPQIAVLIISSPPESLRCLASLLGCTLTVSACAVMINGLCSPFWSPLSDFDAQPVVHTGANAATSPELLLHPLNHTLFSSVVQVHSIPPFWIAKPPTDTCGAGDAYAAGFLYGLLNGFDVPSMGRAAARVASIIISRSGASLSADEADQLAGELPLANHRELSIAPQPAQQCSDSR